MEWSSECTQLQLTHVTSTATSRLNYVLCLKGSYLTSEAFWACHQVLSYSSCKILTEKQESDFEGLLSLWTKMQWQKLVLSPRSLCFNLRLCTSCNLWSLPDPTTLVQPFLRVVSGPPIHCTVGRPNPHVGWNQGNSNSGRPHFLTVTSRK